MGIKQGIKKKFKLKNKNANFKITSKYAYGQTLKNNKLSYKESYSRKITNLRYKD